MERKEALREAHEYLRNTNTGDFLKNQVGKNPDLSYMGVAHAVADVIQKGANPKEVDFQKVDWGVSYSNIRKQTQELAEKRGGQEFQGKKEDRIKSQMDKAEELAKERKHEQLERKARVVQGRRTEEEQYTDQTKNADEVIRQLDNENYQRWRRNPEKFDVKGVDTRTPEERRPNIKPPFGDKKSLIQEMKESVREEDSMDLNYAWRDDQEKLEAVKTFERSSSTKDMFGEKAGDEGIKELTRKGTIVGKDASEILREKDVENLTEGTPAMYVTEEMIRNLRAKDYSPKKESRSSTEVWTGEETGEDLDRMKDKVETGGSQITSKSYNSDEQEFF